MKYRREEKTLSCEQTNYRPLTRQLVLIIADEVPSPLFEFHHKKKNKLLKKVVGECGCDLGRRVMEEVEEVANRRGSSLTSVVFELSH